MQYFLFTGVRKPRLTTGFDRRTPAGGYREGGRPYLEAWRSTTAGREEGGAYGWHTTAVPLVGCVWMEVAEESPGCILDRDDAEAEEDREREKRRKVKESDESD